MLLAEEVTPGGMSHCLLGKREGGVCVCVCVCVFERSAHWSEV